MTEKVDKIATEQVDKDRFNYVYYDKITEFISYLEMGDLATASLIIYGFVLYGMTRIGKTATAHLLSGNPLRGIKKGGQDMVITSTSKNYSAKIGNTMNSETVIPNKFELKNYKVNGETACVVDTPGYGDTYGVLKILANGFFHYRLYSKIQNMKFIVCFDSISVKNTGKDTIDTIVQFTKSFKDYASMKEKIWNSCCFLFTKVDLNEDSIETIKQKLQTIVDTVKTQMKAEQLKLVKQFIQYMINEDKIFIIQKYKEGNSSNDAHLLSNIDQKVKSWWSRGLNPQKPDEVDMTDVAFPLGKDVVIQTTKNEMSQEQLAELVKMYNFRIEEFVDGQKPIMRKIFQQLVNDSLGAPCSRNFLTIMANYVNKYYPKPKKGQKLDGYQEERQKEEIRLFQTNADLSNSRIKDPQSDGKKVKAKNYPIKKLRALQKIQELMKKINEKEFNGRDITWLQQCEIILFQIIKELSKVAYTRNDRKNIVYRYGYTIRRIIQEAKVFVLLLEKFSPNATKLTIKQKCNGKQIELFRPLKDFMGIGFSYNKKGLRYQQLHEIYVKNFDPEDKINKDLEITEDFVNFFDDGQIEDYDTKLKVAKIVHKYSTQTLNNKTRAITHKEQLILVQKLLKAMNSCHDLHALFEEKKDKDKAMMMIRKLGKNLGRVLEDLKKYEIARKVYDSILYVDSVCRVYRNEIEGIDSQGASSVNVRISYGKYLMAHLREADAIKLLQQTYQIAEQSQQLEPIRQSLSESMIAYKDKTQAEYGQYGKDIFAQVYFQKLNEETIKQIQTLYLSYKDQKDKQNSKISKQITLS